MTRFSSFLRLKLACLAAAALGLGLPPSVKANVPGGGDQGPDVHLEQRSAREVVLSNGLVSATIETSNAEVVALTYKGREMLKSGGGHQSIYFSRDGGGDYERLPHCEYSVTTQTPDTIDVCCRHVYLPGKDKHAWDVEAHFVLRRGAHGLYVYTVNSHPASYPAMSVGEWRMVWPMPEKDHDWMMEKVCIDELRHWRLATAADYEKVVPVSGAPKEVMKFTTGAYKDALDCKYVYVGIYHDLGCWGYASDVNHLGAWYVFGSHEYFTNGPFKQDLTATLGSLNLVHLNMNHFNGTEVRVAQGQSWEKVYGPYLLYFNEETDAKASWRDADAQAAAERAAWPYAWVNHPAYPRAEARGSVHGRLQLSDRLKPGLTAAGAWVGLALPDTCPEGGFQTQGAGYQYWVHATADGSFDIRGVRPGSYTLYAVAKGVVGEFSRTAITVDAGSQQDVGVLEWKVPHRGHLAWEIGVPDRRSTEFYHGKDYFQPLLLWRDSRQLPSPLDYYVGKSDPSKDWNYAQSYHADTQGLSVTAWRIHFDLEQTPAADGELVIAIAGAHEADLSVQINGERDQRVPLHFQGGNALIRESDHAKYELIRLPVSAKALRKGENIITLTQGKARSQSAIMYDYLALELP